MPPPIRDMQQAPVIPPMPPPISSASTSFAPSNAYIDNGHVEVASPNRSKTVLLLVLPILCIIAACVWYFGFSKDATGVKAAAINTVEAQSTSTVNFHSTVSQEFFYGSWSVQNPKTNSNDFIPFSNWEIGSDGASWGSNALSLLFDCEKINDTLFLKCRGSDGGTSGWAATLQRPEVGSIFAKLYPLEKNELGIIYTNPSFLNGFRAIMNEDEFNKNFSSTLYKVPEAAGNIENENGIETKETSLLMPEDVLKNGVEIHTFYSTKSFSELKSIFKNYCGSESFFTNGTSITGYGKKESCYSVRIEDMGARCRIDYSWECDSGGL